MTFQIDDQQPFSALSCNFFTLFCVLGLSFLFWGCDSSNSFLQQDPVEIPAPREVNNEDYTVRESGLKIFDFTVGPGSRADSNLVVQIHYIMWLEQDSSLVNSSYLTGRALVTQLGNGNLIQGMEEGIIGMGVGGDRQIVVPSFLAFGQEGAPNIGVPSNATIIVEVALLGVGVVNQ